MTGRDVINDTESEDMRNKSNATLFTAIIFPAVMPAILLPIIVSNHISDKVFGVTFGFFIGLAIVALVWMAKRRAGCAAPKL